mmetsp:Transcript_39702/g.122514  ORF Transcript_39702/g.122514 Transcript_39702/m.122514 type:complete len:334 (+) Transcript_39702:143-1144(+)
MGACGMGREARGLMSASAPAPWGLGARSPGEAQRAGPGTRGRTRHSALLREVLLEGAHDPVGARAELLQGAVRILGADQDLVLPRLELLLPALEELALIRQGLGDLLAQLADDLEHRVRNLHLRLLAAVVRGLVQGLLMELQGVAGLLELLADAPRPGVDGVHGGLHGLLGVGHGQALPQCLLGLRQRALGLLWLHAGHPPQHALRGHGFPALEHLPLIAELPEEGRPDVREAHALASEELPSPPEDLRDLLEERARVRGVGLHLAVGIHEDGEEHVEQQHADDQDKDPEPERRGQQADPPHLLVVPVPKHHAEAGDGGTLPGREVLEVLAKE